MTVQTSILQERKMDRQVGCLLQKTYDISRGIVIACPTPAHLISIIRQLCSLGFTPIQVQRWAMIDLNHQGHSTPLAIMVGSVKDINQGLNESMHSNSLGDLFKEAPISTKLKAFF